MHKFADGDKEIKNGAQLTVRENLGSNAVE